MPEFEVLVIDNGSRIGLQEWLPFCSGLPGRLRIVREETRGFFPARRAALESSVGNFIVWLDDDTIADENYLSAGWRYFSENADSGVVISEVAYAIRGKAGWLRKGLHDARFTGKRPSETDMSDPFHANPVLAGGTGLWMKKGAESFFLDTAPRLSETLTSALKPLAVRPMMEDLDLALGALVDGHSLRRLASLKAVHVMQGAETSPFRLVKGAYEIGVNWALFRFRWGWTELDGASSWRAWDALQRILRPAPGGYASLVWHLAFRLGQEAGCRLLRSNPDLMNTLRSFHDGARRRHGSSKNSTTSKA